MSSDDVNLVYFNGSSQLGRVTALHHTLPKDTGHILHVVFVQSEFLGNLVVTEIQAYQVQAPDPLTQGLMMPCKHRSHQVIKLPLAVQTAVPLSEGLSIVTALLGDGGGGAMWALHAMRPRNIFRRPEDE